MEDRLSRIEKDIQKIMTNDLPHLKTKLVSLEVHQKWAMAILLLVLGSVIAGSFVNFFK